jgi:hypothetical protein
MTANLLSETIKEISDIQDKLKKNQRLKTDAVNRNSAHVSERIKGLKSCATFHALERGKTSLILKT